MYPFDKTESSALGRDSRVRATWREWVNLWLVRIGVRKVLPAVWINAVEVRDCHEELVPWKGVLVRSGVARRLDVAERSLPPRFSLVAKSGWRGEIEQAKLREEALRRGVRPEDLSKAVAGRSGHAAGGAVDVVLCEGDCEVDMGGGYLDFKSGGNMKALTVEQRNARRLLRHALQKAGFVNYPLEWWHYSYGDRMWAAYSRRRFAIYGEVRG